MKKIALITGASHGIGLEIAKVLDSQFDNLILVAKHKDNLNKVVHYFKTKVEFFPVDLTNKEKIEEFTAQIRKKFSSLDLLVNDAGMYIGKRFEKTSTDEIVQLIDLNLKSYFLLTNQLIPLLVKGKNSQIINISSCAASAQIYGEAVYSATKAGVTAFSNVLRKELNGKGIRITTIQPWGVDTYGASQPQLLKPEEIGSLVEYIVTRPSGVQIDQVELSNIKQWRGEKPSWIE